MREKMTNAKVERFPWTEADKAKSHCIFWDAGDGAVKGFGLRYYPDSGAKTYFLQFRVRGTGKMRAIKIGRHGDPWGAEQARDKARDLKKLMDGGTDPVEQARKEAAEKRAQEVRDRALSTTLRTVMERYVAEKETVHGPLRPATIRDIRKHCEGENLKDWLDEPVRDITSEMCVARFRSITKRGAPMQANQCMVYLRALLNFAKVIHATEDGQFPILAVNPVNLALAKEKLNRKKARTRRMELSRVGPVWSMLRHKAVREKTDFLARTGTDYVRLMLLTAIRKEEAGKLTWKQCDMQAKTITLLPEVTKNHNGLTLPMSDALHELLVERRALVDWDSSEDRLTRVQRRARMYLFPSDGKMPHMKDPRITAQMVAEIAGCKRVDATTGKIVYELSPHDYRRVLMDVAINCKVDPVQRMKLLNHVSGKSVQLTNYENNPDPELLRPAVNAIARFFTDAATVFEAQQSGANVVSLMDRRAS